MIRLLASRQCERLGRGAETCMTYVRVESKQPELDLQKARQSLADCTTAALTGATKAMRGSGQQPLGGPNRVVRSTQFYTLQGHYNINSWPAVHLKQHQPGLDQNQPHSPATGRTTERVAQHYPLTPRRALDHIVYVNLYVYVQLTVLIPYCPLIR
eukprot:359555-Chlamydomonas_euryale.AAC.3